MTNLPLDNYSYDAITIYGYDLSTTPQSLTLTGDNLNQTIIFKYERQISNLYVIELSKFNIFNDDTEAVKITKCINATLIYAK